MISLFLENENDTVTNKITAFVQILAGCKKQKVLKSVLVKQSQQNLIKLRLFVLKQYQTTPMQWRDKDTHLEIQWQRVYLRKIHTVGHG